MPFFALSFCLFLISLTLFSFINWNRRQLCKRHTESTDTCPCCRQTSRQLGRLWQLLHPKKLSPVVPVVVYNAHWMILTICFLTQLSQVLFGCEYPGCSQGYVLATLCLSFQSAIIVAFLRKAIIVAFLRKATFGSGRTVTSETLSLWTQRNLNTFILSTGGDGTKKKASSSS